MIRLNLTPEKKEHSLESLSLPLDMNLSKALQSSIAEIETVLNDVGFVTNICDTSKKYGMESFTMDMYSTELSNTVFKHRKTFEQLDKGCENFIESAITKIKQVIASIIAWIKDFFSKRFGTKPALDKIRKESSSLTTPDSVRAYMDKKRNRLMDFEDVKQALDLTLEFIREFQSTIISDVEKYLDTIILDRNNAKKYADDTKLICARYERDLAKLGQIKVHDNVSLNDMHWVSPEDVTRQAERAMAVVTINEEILKSIEQHSNTVRETFKNDKDCLENLNNFLKFNTAYIAEVSRFMPVIVSIKESLSH